MSLLRRRLLTSCAFTLALVALSGAATPPLPEERIAPGVTAAGIDVAGLTADEAAQRLQDAYGARLGENVVAQVADLTFRLSAERANVVFDTQRSALRALYAGRQLATQPAPAPGAAPSAVDVPLAVTYSKRELQRFASRIARRLHRPAVDARLRITIRRVRVTRSRPGRDLDARALATQVAAALADPRQTRLLKPPLRVVKAKLTADKLRASSPTVITIHRATFTLRLFKNLKLRKRYEVAVGLPDYPTPRGRFSIISKQVNPVWSVPNSPWAGELAGGTVSGGSAANPLKARWMGIANGVGIHGTGQGYSIGTRASHGCIRMHVADVIALYKRVPVGTRVLIS